MNTKKPGRLAKRARVGEYVLASMYLDCDPNDPWRVGYVCVVEETWKPRPGFHRFVYVIGYEDGTTDDQRCYRYCRHITAEEGAEWIALYEKETGT